VNTLNKLIEISTKKEEKNKINKDKKKAPRKQINVPTERIIEQSDKTRVARIPTNTKKSAINLRKKLLQTRPEKKEQEKK
jgi:hypothetical protein